MGPPDIDKGNYTGISSFINLRANLHEVDQLCEKSYADTIKQLALSVGCIMPAQVLKESNGVHTFDRGIHTLKSHLENSGAYEQLDSKIPFQNEKRAGFGTIFLLERNLVFMTAHTVCKKGSNELEDKSILDNFRIVFGFQLDEENQNTHRFDSKYVCKIKKVVAHKYSRSESDPNKWMDWALVKIDRDLSERVHLKVDFADSVQPETPLYMLGHSEGLALKYTRNAKVVTSTYRNYFDSDLSGFIGNSGSPVLHAITHKVVGIYAAGKPDYYEENKILKPYCYTKEDVLDRGAEKCQRTNTLPFVEDYIKAVYYGDLIAQERLSLYYKNGFEAASIQLDKKKFKKWDTKYYSGSCYHHFLSHINGSNGFQQDTNLAYKYAEAAAKLNHKEACYELFIAYKNGTPDLIIKAYSYCEKAADLNHKDAAYEMFLVSKQRGNMEKAQEYLLKAAALGSLLAKNALEQNRRRTILSK